MDVFIVGESSDSDEKEVIREPSRKKTKSMHLPKWKLGPELENLSEFEFYEKVFGEMFFLSLLKQIDMPTGTKIALHLN